ncbi:MAG: ribosome biogenesis GTPase Der [Deltaproteobacteria bacterium]|nr:MAG: ribosome biogenesis GTPase Der [Deltaproteobacteria bacterium]
MNTIIAIVGRPNVGKSTLFNRLTRGTRAIIDDIPGVTRDRNYAEAQWEGNTFTLVDTGGFVFDSKDELSRLIQKQAQLAIDEADVIIYLTDGREGPTPLDTDLIKLIRTIPKPIFYCINKIDGPRQEENIFDFYQLGIDNWYLISAKHSRGVSELMDAVVKKLPERKSPLEEEDAIKVAVLGRPNVGKSSLVNRILGYDRVIVSETPGTTRDAIDTPFKFKGQKYIIIDTAGIRRKSRIGFKLERYCVFEALRALRRCDLSLVIIDAEEGITEQDTKIAGEVYNKGKACILVVNKWDLIQKDNSTVGKYVTKIKEKMKFLDFAPIIFVSALSGQRVNRILDKIYDCFTQFKKRVSTSELNRFLRQTVKEFPPPLYRGKQIKFYYLTQVDVKPPKFVFFANFPQAIHFSYQRYLSNRLREIYGFEGTPIRLNFRNRR